MMKFGVLLLVSSVTSFLNPDLVSGKPILNTSGNYIEPLPSNREGRIPTVKLKIPEKAFLKSKSRISVTFKL